jgi:hypothetical protein
MVILLSDFLENNHSYSSILKLYKLESKKIKFSFIYKTLIENEGEFHNDFENLIQ